jgi:hypothetical protein
MQLSIRKTNDRPIGNATMTMRDLMVHAISKTSAVLRISPTNWSGPKVDVKLHIEMNLQELKSLRADINSAIEALEGV